MRQDRRTIAAQMRPRKRQKKQKRSAPPNQRQREGWNDTVHRAPDNEIARPEQDHNGQRGIGPEIRTARRGSIHMHGWPRMSDQTARRAAPGSRQHGSDIAKRLFKSIARAQAAEAQANPGGRHGKIGRADVLTPVTHAHIVSRLLLEKKKNTSHEGASGMT